MSSSPRRLILLALVTLRARTRTGAGGRRRLRPLSTSSSPSGAPFPSDRFTVAGCDAAHRACASTCPSRTARSAPRTARTSTCSTRSTASTSSRGSRSPSRARSISPALRAPTSSSSGCRRRRHRDQPGRLGVADEHAARRVGPAARPAHALPARRHESCDVKDSAGDPIEASSFLQDLNYGHAKDAADKAYRKELIAALNHAARRRRPGGRRRREPLHDPERQRRCSSRCGTRSRRRPRRPRASCSARRASARCSRSPSVTGILFTPAGADGGDPDPADVHASPLPTRRSRSIPGSVGTIAFGAFDSPDYETASKVIPAVGSATGVPAVQGTNRIYFNLFLPAGAAPAGRLAGRDLRPRLRRQQELEPVPSSPRRWRVAASPRSRSTSSATAAARSGR